MSTETKSLSFILLPLVCYMEAGDSFSRLFKDRTCNKHGYTECDRCDNTVSKSTRTLEVAGFSLLGTLSFVPCAIGLVTYVPERIYVSTMSKKPSIYY